MTAILCVLALVLRLALAFGAPVHPDVVQFERTGRAVLAGENLYGTGLLYNYPPPIGYLAAGSAAAADAVGLPFAAVWRAGLGAADMVNGVIVGAIAAAKGKKGAVYTWLYWFNPITIGVAAWWGMFDLLAVLPVLAGCLWLLRSQAARSCLST